MLKVTISLLAIAAALGGAASPLHAGSEKMTGITLVRAIPAQLTLIAQAQVNPSPPTTPDSPFDAGLADRRALESWFASLTGDFKKGAEYWAGQRSSAKPGSCYLQDGTSAGEWTEGCLAAQRQLTPIDVRRKAEPDYRQGWNAYSPTATPAPVAAAPSPAAEPSQAYKEGLADRQDWEEYFNALSDQTKEGAEYWVSHRSLPEARCQPMTVEQQGQWQSGCLSAKLQLDPADKRRLAEPEYRQGWNSYAASGSQPTAPSVASTSAQTAAKGADTAPPTEPASPTPQAAVAPPIQRMGNTGTTTSEFDCSRPKMDALGLCFDFDTAQAAADPRTKQWEDVIRIVRSDQDIKELYGCVEQTITGRRLVGGIQAFRQVPLALHSCGMVVALARYLPPAEAVSFACTEGFLLLEILYGQMTDQQFIGNNTGCVKYFLLPGGGLQP